MERGAARSDALTEHQARERQPGLDRRRERHALRVGCFVIHDADAKRADMLMVVIGCSRDDIYRTHCAFPDDQPRS
jgi:hypothetical protein